MCGIPSRNAGGKIPFVQDRTNTYPTGEPRHTQHTYSNKSCSTRRSPTPKVRLSPPTNTSTACVCACVRVLCALGYYLCTKYFVEKTSAVRSLPLSPTPLRGRRCALGRAAAFDCKAPKPTGTERIVRASVIIEWRAQTCSCHLVRRSCS